MPASSRKSPSPTRPELSAWIHSPRTSIGSRSLSGFETFEELVRLEPGAIRVLDVRLSLSPVAQQVEVVGVAPGDAGDMNRARIPATVSLLGERELSERGGTSLADALNERLGAITLEEATTNPFQPNLRFRGFTASPLLGLPQGVAVYQNGVRINQPFGDTVQFDLIPRFALASAQLSAGAEPVFGLNALGGALSLRLKNGFETGGVQGEFSGGSFGRLIGTAELGASRGRWALYAGATRFAEDGWRQESDSDVKQAVAYLSYRKDGLESGVSFTYADTKLNGNGASDGMRATGSSRRRSNRASCSPATRKSTTPPTMEAFRSSPAIACREFPFTA